jgi:hypothetical protein
MLSYVFSDYRLKLSLSPIATDHDEVYTVADNSAGPVGVSTQGPALAVNVQDVQFFYVVASVMGLQCSAATNNRPSTASSFA